MGRRATNTTKGGRFMNPADQARKQQRKKELKKNKVQRQAVRKAVLKSKDPDDIIEQMEKLDQMEFDPNNEPPLPLRVIQEKRQKLRETFLRVMGMYKRDEESAKFAQMKKKVQEYDLEKSQLEQNYIAVKFARESDPADIPLPDGLAGPGAAMTPQIPHGADLSNVPFPPHLVKSEPAHGILKKSGIRKRSEHPPGPPCGLPPQLSDTDDDEDEDEDYSDDEVERAEKAGRVRFEGVEEEEEEKDSRTKYKKMAKKIAAGEIVHEDSEFTEETADSTAAAAAAPLPLMALRPPMPMFPRFSRPPPPPPGMPPRGPPPSRGPPGGPRPNVGPHRPVAPPPSTAAVISAAPVVKRHSGPTIEAKPQLRNMQQEVTKFIPTTLKVHREGTQIQKKPTKQVSRTFGVNVSSGIELGQKSTDDAYVSFMKEMEGFL